MDRHFSSDDVDFVHQLRTALSPALPYGPTLIPLDIMVAVIQACRDARPMTMKRLCEALPYSVTGIRYNLNQLIKDGWLSKARHQEDRRVVHLMPTADGEHALSEVYERLSDYRRRQ